MITAFSKTKRYLRRIVYGDEPTQGPTAKHRSLLILMAVSVLTILSVGMVAAFSAGDPDKPVSETTKLNEKKQLGSSVTTIVNDNKMSITGGLSMGNPISSSTVYINGKQVVIPYNGSVSRTINDENGTTHLDVTHSASSTGRGSQSSTNLSVSATTESSISRSP